MKKSKPNSRLWQFVLALAVVTLAVYWRVLGNGFTNYDDGIYIIDNPHVNSGLTAANIAWAFNIGYCSNWHPLTWISHMLDCSLFGLNPAGHHAVGLLIHIANTVLLFLVLDRMTRARWQSAFVAALFAIHPLHVESVAWASERKDVLSTLFWMLTMWAYVHWVEKPSVRRYALAMGMFALGLMAKPMLVTLPFVLLLLDYWPLRRSERSTVNSQRLGVFQRLVWEKWPLFAMSAVSGLLTFMAQRKGLAVSSLDLVSPVMRVENALISGVMYIVKTFWPTKLAPFYPLPMQPIPAGKAALAGLALVAISVLVYRARKKAPYLMFGWLWYAITLLPVIGLIQVGAQSMADRYTYVPLVGVFVAVAWGASEMLGKGERERGRKGDTHTPIRPYAHTPTAIVASLVLVVLGAMTYRQVGLWRDSITLFTHTMNVTEENYTAYTNLASAYAVKKDYETAAGFYEQALHYRSDMGMLHYNYANTLYALGKPEEALAEYEEAVRLDPDHEDAKHNLQVLRRKLDYAEQAKALLEKPGADDAATHLNRGVALDAEGKTDQAIAEYKKALELNPDFAEAHSNLGVIYRNQNKLDLAAREYEAAIKAKPELAQAHHNLAIVYYMKGSYAEAWREVHACEALGVAPNPDFVQALAQKMPDPGM